MMGYEDNRNCVGAPEAGMLQGNTAPLSSMMDQANNIAQEILIMAQKINAHMFGVSNPIIDWEESDVWDYLTEQHVESNPLYCEGWKRVGCVGCPMAGKARYGEFAQYPKYRELYIRAFDRMLKRRAELGKESCKAWGTRGVDVYHWWMEDGVLPGQMMIESEEDE